MKKIVSFITVIILILGIFLGYKVVYKASPRDFITKDTRVIYANEGINDKDFTPLLDLVDGERKEKLESELKNLKYISKLYVFSDKEFYALNEKTFSVVVDTGYWYFLLLKNIGKYFDLRDDLYILKREYRKDYFPEIQSDLYMKNYKGLFIFSLSEKNLKDFIAKDGKYLYNKEIENRLDTQKGNLLGTFIYNNTGIEFYGMNYLVNNINVVNNKVISNIEVILDEKESEIFKNTKENRELLKYFGENSLYFSVDDFSRLDRILFNPLVIGANVDTKTVLVVWKNLFGIDIEKILKEIDGEVLYKINEESLMVKIKNNAPEIKRVLNLLSDENSAFYIREKVEEIDGIVKIGDSKFDERASKPTLSRDTFIYGEINSPELLGIEGLEVSIHGEKQSIKMKFTIPTEVFKEIVNEY